MARAIFAVIIGYAVWTVLWLVGNAVLFGSVSDVVAGGQAFTAVGPLLGVIALSVVCSVGAGLSAASVAPAERASVVVLVTAVLLLLTGIGVQSGVWHLMPLWYHATFLALIVPVCAIAGRLLRQASPGKAS